MAQAKDKSKQTFSRGQVDGTVKLTKTVESPPFSTIKFMELQK